MGTARIEPEGAFEAGSFGSFTLTYTAGQFGIDFPLSYQEAAAGQARARPDHHFRPWPFTSLVGPTTTADLRKQTPADLDETTVVERPAPNQLFLAIKVQLVSEIVSRKILSRCRKSIDTRDASYRYRGQ